MPKTFHSDLRWSDVTPKSVWMNRRQLLAGMGAVAVAGPAAAKLGAVPSAYSTTEPPTALADITSYNNFYEFGWDKTDPARYAGQLKTDPWSIEIGGLVDKPGTYGLEDVLKGVTLEERIYRFRCVEAWSMVVPLGRVRARHAPEPGGRAAGRQVRGLRDALSPRRDARSEQPVDRMALSRGPAAGRGDESADHPGDRTV